jgi:polyisoprenyl-phosphate glycosyltransferase
MNLQYAFTHSADAFVLTLLIPCYNEALSLDPLFLALDPALQKAKMVHPNMLVELLFVDDGSSDATVAILLARQILDDRITVVELSRNFGKEAALSAGLRHATGDAVIVLDADLQDPPDLILAMLNSWREGFDVVLAKRCDRTTDSMAKRLSAHAFYWLHNRIADRVRIPKNVGDFRLIDRTVVAALNALPENQRFMKGLFAWVGFHTATIEYARAPRAQGESRFNASALFALAWEGIVGFSAAPLRLFSWAGLLVSSIAFCWGAWIAARTLIFGVDLPGYASLLVSILFLGGIQLLGIGVLGEYIGRIFSEAKRRPAFLVRRVYHAGDEPHGRSANCGRGALQHQQAWSIGCEDEADAGVLKKSFDHVLVR